MFAFVFDESLFAFAYDTPPFAFALLFDRYTTRCNWEIHLFMRGGSNNNSPSLSLSFSTYANAFIALNARTLSAFAIFPRKASREPMAAYVYDES